MLFPRRIPVLALLPGVYPEVLALLEQLMKLLLAVFTLGLFVSGCTKYDPLSLRVRNEVPKSYAKVKVDGYSLEPKIKGSGRVDMHYWSGHYPTVQVFVFDQKSGDCLGYTESVVWVPETNPYIVWLYPIPPVDPSLVVVTPNNIRPGVFRP
jgi:hypothetical protein